MNLWYPTFANCIIWAFGMQWTRGGWVCWRKSTTGWWPHAVWSRDRVEWYEYVPLNFSGKLKWWQVLWIVLFRGGPRHVDRSDL